MPEILGRLRTPRLSAAPVNPAKGEMYYDTVVDKLFWWNGTAWIDSTGGGGGGASVDGGVEDAYSFTLSATTTAPTSEMTNGEMRFNNASQSAVRSIWLTQFDNDSRILDQIAGVINARTSKDGWWIAISTIGGAGEWVSWPISAVTYLDDPTYSYRIDVLAPLIGATLPTGNLVVSFLYGTPASGATTWKTGAGPPVVISTITKMGETAPYAKANPAGTTAVFTVPAGGIPVGATIVLVTAGYFGGEVASVIDSKGNAYTVRIAVGYNTQFTDCRVTTALVAGDTITITLSGQAGDFAGACAWFSGMASANYFDKMATGAFASIAPANGPPIVTAEANELVIASYGADTSGTAYAYVSNPGAGWTDQIGASNTNGYTISVDWITRIVANAGTVQPAPTLAGGKASGPAAVIAYRSGSNPLPGNDGDWYYDTSNSDVYQYVTNAWVKRGNLAGTPPEVNISTAGPSPRVGEVLWVDTDENPIGVGTATLESQHIVGQPGEPAFQNSWVNYDAGIYPNARSARFRKYHDGRVRISGFVRGGAAGSVIFTLPVGYRPQGGAQSPLASFVTGCSGGNALVYIDGTGTVYAYGIGSAAPGTYLYLDGIEFDTDTVTTVSNNTVQPLDTWHTIGAAGEPAFQGGVANESAGNPAQYRKDPFGKVQMRGRVLCPATAALTIFTLPVGYRPPVVVGFETLRYDVDSRAYCYVTTAGTVVKNTAAATYLDLAEIEFDTDTVANWTPATLPANVISLDPWHMPGTPGEVAFADVNWKSYGYNGVAATSVEAAGGTYTALAYRKDQNGRVTFKGFLNSGVTRAAITTAFTLPLGYRPSKRILHHTNINATTVARLDIDVDGSVIAYTAIGTANSWISMEGLTFDTDSVQNVSSNVAVPIDGWHTIGAAGEPSFQSNWVNYDTNTYAAAAFRKNPLGRVSVRGLIKSGTVGAVAFTLPAGFRPPRNQSFPGQVTGGTTQVMVQSDGQVLILAGPAGTTPGTFTYLDAIEFDTDTISSVVMLSGQVPVNVDQWHLVGSGGLEPAFQNGWTNYATGYATVAFMKDALGYVHMRGDAKPGTIATTMFTLPVGYRPGPNGTIVLPVAAFTTVYVAAGVAISPAGAVQHQGPAGQTQFWLDGTSFLAEQ